MTYSETLEYIYSRIPMFQMVGKSAYKEGLESMIDIDNHLGNPHRAFRTIHVGGTNGKGSVSHSLASVLQSAGYKVGLFTSPHLKDFRERIRVNGECVPELFVVEFIERERSFIEEVHPSFFEVSVGMAFEYFKDQKIDVAVVEVGLGGRLDSTNIITPDLCVITNISSDHTNILGKTLVSIAREKAGIMKRGIPVVIGEAKGGVRAVFEARAKEVGAPIEFADETPSRSLGMGDVDGVPVQTVSVDGVRVRTPLLGLYQRKNIVTVWRAIDHLRRVGYRISEEQALEGCLSVVRQTHLLGRWQQLQDAPKVVCDTGHNVGGIRYVVRQLRKEKCDTLRIVFGMVGDKDISHVLELLPREAVYYFTRASIQRAMPETELAKLAETKGLCGRTFPTVRAALDAALSESSPSDFIYVGGSTYVVAEII